MNTQTMRNQGLPFLLQLDPVVKLTDQQLFRFRQLNHDLRIERTNQGALDIATPVSEPTSWRKTRLFTMMVSWALRERMGMVFDASGGFVLPSGAVRSPDVAWVRKSRLARFTKKQRNELLPLVPDFALYVCSEVDSLETLRAKIYELIEAGTNLAWILEPEHQRVYVYTPGEPELCLENPSSISGEPILRGFSLHPDPIWKTEL